jgi:hypothetical protein
MTENSGDPASSRATPRQNFGVEKKLGVGRIETVVPAVWETIEYDVIRKG